MRQVPWTFGVLFAFCARTPAAEVALREHAIEEPWGNAVIQAADFDGDKDCDFITISDSGLSLVENIDDGKRYALHEIEATVFPANVAIPVDVDGDGDMDMVTHALFWEGAVDWSENQGKGKPWPKHALLEGRIGSKVKALALADADGDEDLDLVFGGDGAKWLANQDGKGSEWAAPGDVGDIKAKIVAITVADFDGDHDNDVVASDYDRDELIYAESDGQAWKGRRVVTKADRPSSLPVYLQAIDFDKDGDQDVFTVAPSGEVAFLENQDGKGQLAKKFWARTSGVVLARPADIDNDGDYDVLTACNVASDGVRWIENEGAKFGKLHDVNRDWERPSVLEAFDFDGDGDIDIVSVSNDIDGKRTAWWENLSR